MAADIPIILKKGQALITNLSVSVNGLRIQNDPSGNSLQWGIIVMASDLSNGYAANDYVSFYTKNATLLSYEGDNYFLITEDEIFFKEIAPP